MKRDILFVSLLFSFMQLAQDVGVIRGMVLGSPRELPLKALYQYCDLLYRKAPDGGCGLSLGL